MDSIGGRAHVREAGDRSADHARGQAGQGRLVEAVSTVVELRITGRLGPERVELGAARAEESDALGERGSRGGGGELGSVEAVRRGPGRRGERRGCLGLRLVALEELGGIASLRSVEFVELHH